MAFPVKGRRPLCLVASLACLLGSSWASSCKLAEAAPAWQPSHGSIEDEPTFEAQVGGSPPACAESLEAVAPPAEGSESSAWWTYVAALSSATSCSSAYSQNKALAARLFVLDDEAVSTREVLEALGVQLANLASDVAEVREATHELASSSCGNPCPVSIDKAVSIEDSAAAEYNGELVSAVDAAGESSKSGLYLLFGAIVGTVIVTFIGWALRRGGA